MKLDAAKLTVRLVDGVPTPGHRGLVVFDERGRQLAGQRGVDLKWRMGEASILIVEFVVDGERVKVEAP